MKVVVGPVSSESARAWIDYARSVLRTGRADDAQTLPDDLRAGFEGYLTAWEGAARSSEMRWEAEIDPEVLEYLVHGFYRVATHLSEEADRTGVAEAPPAGDAFYRALVTGLLDAMEAEGSAACADFAEQLRAFWPGLAGS